MGRSHLQPVAAERQRRKKLLPRATADAVERGSNDFALVLADRRSIAEIDERRAAFRLLRAMSSILSRGLATYRESGTVAKERRKPTRLRQSCEIGGGS